MRLLLDTHVLIWWWMGDASLPDKARSAIIDPQRDVYVSAATAWEIATKVCKGHLPEMRSRLQSFRDDVSADQFRYLDVRIDHGVRGGLLSSDHQDPFDRLIAAQALIEDMTVVTRERAFAEFGCEVIWS